MFRKGTVLLGPEEMEGEYDGEELRREVGWLRFLTLRHRLTGTITLVTGSHGRTTPSASDYY